MLCLETRRWCVEQQGSAAILYMAAVMAFRMPWSVRLSAEGKCLRLCAKGASVNDRNHISVILTVN